MRMPSSEEMHATVCNRAIDRMSELDTENRVLRRALELACIELSELSASSELYGDTMTMAIRPAAGFEIRFLTQAWDAERKGSEDANGT